MNMSFSLYLNFAAVPFSLSILDAVFAKGHLFPSLSSSLLSYLSRFFNFESGTVADYIEIQFS